MKNIILLITDTFRYDNLFDRAERPVRTPALDRFITAKATAVEGFYSGSFPTIPHRTDVATGRLGWPHYGWQAIEKSSKNHIAQMLGKAGYETQLLCDCPHLFNAHFQHGFRAACQIRGQEGDTPLLRLNDPVVHVVPPNKTRRINGDAPTLADLHRWTNRYFETEQDTFAARTGLMTMRWLEENYKGGPFFTWVDFFDPHEPWDPPEYMVKRYDPTYDGTPMIHPNYGSTDVYTPAEAHNLWAHYAAEAELVDRWVGRVLDKIDELGLLESSIVVITSDHGHSVGDHNRAGKTNISSGEDSNYWPLYPEVNRVPFILAGAGVPPGKSLDIIGQPIDILPTICELADVDVDAPEPIEGKSFAPIVKTGTGEHREFAVSATCMNVSDGVGDRATTPAVVTKDWAYYPVGQKGDPELYNIKEDPHAKNNVAADNKSVLSEMHDRLIRQLEEHHADQGLIDGWKRVRK